MFVSGSDANLFVGSTSFVADAVNAQLLYAVASLLLDSATGDDLDRYAWDRYRVTRKDANAAVVDVTFSRPSSAGGPGTIQIGQGITSQAGIQYALAVQVSFGPTQLVNSVGFARANSAGSASSVTRGQLNQLSTSGLFDQSITAVNPENSAGGTNRETDDTFRERIRGYWNTARRGILAAIAYGALQVPGVTSAIAEEVIAAYTPSGVVIYTTGSGLTPQEASVYFSAAVSQRVVQLYIADSDGNANKALANLVATQLDDYRAAGIAVLINTSIPQLEPVTLDLQFQAGVDTVGLTATILAAVLSYVNSLPVNGVLSYLGIGTVLSTFVQDGLILNYPAAGSTATPTIVAPAADVVPAIGSTIRTTAALVTAS